jgi:hypothetical protein
MYDCLRPRTPTLTPLAFIDKWVPVTLNEQSTAHEYFNDLCRLIGHPTPSEADPYGHFYRFQKRFILPDGKSVFVDVWKSGVFAWEFKTRDKYPILDGAIKRLIQSREVLQTVRVFVVSDINRIEIYGIFNGTLRKLCVLTLDDLLTDLGRERLWNLFFAPDLFLFLNEQADDLSDTHQAIEQRDPATEAFQQVVNLWQATIELDERRHEFPGWDVLWFHNEPVAYRKNGDDYWRIPTSSKAFKTRVVKSAIQRHGLTWSRRGWVKLIRGEVSAIQGIFKTQSRCISVLDQVLKTWRPE